jgi:hypothetical protein
MERLQKIKFFWREQLGVALGHLWMTFSAQAEDETRLK